MDLEKRISILKESSICWTRLGFGFDPPRQSESGSFLLFNYDFENYLKIHRDFYNAGVKVHSTILPGGWLEADKYDFTAVSEVLDALFTALPDIYYLPRIKLNVPVDWCLKNPTEVFVYNNGPRTEEEIKSLVGTLKHDYLGFDSASGYNGNGGNAKDNRPNVDGVICMQSISSRKWLEDAGNYLKMVIEYLESSKYASKIIGYHIAYGACGETITWGTWVNDINRKGDFGISASKAFTKAYPQYNYVPSAEKRYGHTKSLEDFFRVKDDEKICIDYSRFISQVNADAIEHFCKIVKEIVPDKVTGVFNAYIIGTLDAAYSGHLAIDRLVNSPYINFISAPKGYYKCGPFGPGLEQAPSNSIAQKKLWLDEIDNKTYLDKRGGEDRAENFEQTRYVLLREFAKNISHNQGYWWMDLGENCFDDENILADIKLMGNTANELRKKFGDGERTAEVLMLIDENSMHYTVPSQSFHGNFIKYFASNVKQCGTLTDLYRLSDIKSIDIKKYKVIIFLNSFCISDDIYRYLMENIQQNATLIWNYAAGIISNEYNIDNVYKITGFKIDMYSSSENIVLPEGGKPDFPVIYIKNSSNVKALKTYDDGKTMIGKCQLAGKFTSILCALPTLSIDELYDIFSNAGVHMYADKYCTVYGDSRFIYVIAGENVSFELKFKRETDCTDIISGKRYNKIVSLPLKLKKGTGIFLKYCLEQAE